METYTITLRNSAGGILDTLTVTTSNDGPSFLDLLHAVEENGDWRLADGDTLHVKREEG
jgi:hypothetical protein